MKWNDMKVSAAMFLALAGCSDGGASETSTKENDPPKMSAETGDATTTNSVGGATTGAEAAPMGGGGATAGSGGSGETGGSDAMGTGGDTSDGWVPIFDGLTTDGWEPHAREPSVLEVVDGELHLDSARNLWVVYHPLEMSDFEAEAEVLFPEGASEAFNTGFGFRMPTDASSLPTGGYQLDLDNGDPSITGALHVVATTYVFPPGGNRQNAAFAAATDDLFDPSEWIRMRVRAEGDHIQLWVNDQLVSDVTYEGRTSGAFGIQHHGGPSGTARFRNLRAREL